MKGRSAETRYGLCVKNKGYPASLEIRKIYRIIADSGAAKHGFIRIIDESGEDYLCPKDYFVSIALPKLAEKAFSPTTRAGGRVEVVVREGVARWRRGKPCGARRPPGSRGHRWPRRSSTIDGEPERSRLHQGF